MKRVVVVKAWRIYLALLLAVMAGRIVGTYLNDSLWRFAVRFPTAVACLVLATPEPRRRSWKIIVPSRND